MPWTTPSRALRPLSIGAFVATLLVPAAAPGQAAEPPAGDSPQEQASYGTLADVLENEQARQRLIEDLRRMAAERQGEGADQAAAGLALPERIAVATRAAVEQVVGELEAAVAAVSALWSGPGVDWDAFAVAATELGSLVVVTLLVFLALRWIERAAYARASAWVLRGSGGGGALVRRAVAATAAAGLDGATIVLAWVAGWALALFVLGEAGAISTRLSLFLNAFVVIEGLKLFLRIVFAPRDDGLRLLPVAGEEAAYWYAWLAHLAGFVGYGTLLVVPVVSAELAPSLGRFVYVLVLALGFVYALAIILQNRARVRARLEAASHAAQVGTARMTAAVLARVWHLVAIAYLVALTGALLTRPEQALPYMAVATLQSLVAVGLGILVGAVIGRAISKGIRVPEATRAKFPQLEARLNAFVPRGLQGIRLVLVVLVVALVLDAWRLFDLGAWLASETGVNAVYSLVSVLVILALAAGAWIVIASWIDYRLSPDTGSGEPDARRRTLLALLRNAVAVVIVTMAAMITLSELGINIGPLLAGAGVLGLAIGFGAQKLVQDIIGGVFIQLENAINTGDWVTAGGISGTAERLSIRSVGLRDLEGTFHIVPFSSVDTVSNYMRDFAFHIGYYGVAYREDPEEVVRHLGAAFEELKQDPVLSQYITSELTVDGISGLGDSSVNFRVRIRTTPGFQWMVGRGYNRLVKKHFDAAGIEIPFPHTTLYFGQDKDGSAPPAHLHLEGGAGDDDGRGE